MLVNTSVPIDACCAAGHLSVGLSPVSLFLRTFCAHFVLIDPPESR